MTANRRTTVFALALLVSEPAGMIGQTAAPQKSLAEMAAQANTKKAEHARVVMNDDSVQAQKPLIPNVWEGDCDNSDAIVAAISDYRRSHSKAETEELMHAWYDKHASMLDHAADENRRIQHGRDNSRSMSPYDYAYMRPGDYRQYYESQLAASRSAYDDQWRYAQNYQTVYRTETVFARVKTSVRRMGMDFDWFKLHCGMQYCTY